jgi:hypothetical protein
MTLLCDCPAGAVVRVFRDGTNEFLGETVADGSGTVTLALLCAVDDEFIVKQYVQGVDGGTTPVITSLVLTP